MEADRISIVTPEGLTEASGYDGIAREVAFETKRAILTRVRAEPGASTDWHHHGDREVHGHLLRGRIRFQFGPGGTRARRSRKAVSSTYRLASSTAT